MEVEAVDEGRLDKILVAEGTEGVAVNTPIATLADSGAAAGAHAAAPASAVVLAPAGVPAGARAQAAAPQMAHVAAAAPAGERDWGPARPTSVREALRDAMAAELEADPNVFLMGEEVAQYQGAYKISQGLLDRFGPRRIIDMPITEHGFTGMGGGCGDERAAADCRVHDVQLAMQAIDQIINSAAKTLYMSGGQMGCPIVFRGPNGAASRVAAQHSQDYASWYAHCPGLKVVAPYSSADAKDCCARRSAIKSGDFPGE